MYYVFVVDLCDNYVHDTTVPCWQDVEKVYFDYYRQCPDCFIRILTDDMLFDELGSD